MSRSHATVRGCERLIGAAVALVIVALLLTAHDAVAFASDAPATPIMTVTDPRIQPCGAIAVTGSSFAPSTKLTMVLSGKTLAEHPTTDAAGGFTFNTSVPCEQRSGSVQLKASDGTTTVGVDVTIGTPEVATTMATNLEPAATRSDHLGLWAARVLLVLVMAGELVLLVTRRRRRARRLRPTPAR